jgi:hypothetical protein
MRQELLDHAHRPAQIDLDFARHVVQVAILIEIKVAHDAGVVDEHIESRELSEHAVMQRCDSRRITDIALKHMDTGQRALGGI